jgi:hypothetical protein
VLGVPDHVHDLGDYRNAGLMQPVHSVLGRDTDGAHEQGGFLFDDNLNKLCELSLRVVILCSAGSGLRHGNIGGHSRSSSVHYLRPEESIGRRQMVGTCP